jgi:hypothetical protein
VVPSKSLVILLISANIVACELDAYYYRHNMSLPILAVGDRSVSSLYLRYGKVVARKIRAIENILNALAEKHQEFFATQRSKYAAEGEHRSATITEFVEPRWINLQPTLWVDPALPAHIAAEFTTCFQAAISQ